MGLTIVIFHASAGLNWSKRRVAMASTYKHASENLVVRGVVKVADEVTSEDSRVDCAIVELFSLKHHVACDFKGSGILRPHHSSQCAQRVGVCTSALIE